MDLPCGCCSQIHLRKDVPDRKCWHQRWSDQWGEISPLGEYPMKISRWNNPLIRSPLIPALPSRDIQVFPRSTRPGQYYHHAKIGSPNEDGRFRIDCRDSHKTSHVCSHRTKVRYIWTYSCHKNQLSVGIFVFIYHTLILWCCWGEAFCWSLNMTVWASQDWKKRLSLG